MVRARAADGQRRSKQPRRTREHSRARGARSPAETPAAAAATRVDVSLLSFLNMSKGTSDRPLASGVHAEN
jgi:hypothetical protein